MASSRLLPFSSDYMCCAHPAVLQRLCSQGSAAYAGYGTDAASEEARQKIRAACEAPRAAIYFLAGGTQANAMVIDALLQPWQGVLSVESGHICVHEAGAVERWGHKTLPLPQEQGKVTLRSVQEAVEAWQRDENRDHMIMPGMLYISHPTEYGTLYSLAELRALSALCREKGLKLFLDGARLAYALASPANDVTLKDIAACCDAFYIGGTKCGTLFGEAVVLPDAQIAPHFFTMVKQRGALLAKGFVTALQFDALFTDGLYGRIGESANRYADQLRQALRQFGYPLVWENPTNQVFFEAEDSTVNRLSQEVSMGYMQAAGPGRSVMRLCTSWATSREDVERLTELLAAFGTQKA